MNEIKEYLTKRNIFVAIVVIFTLIFLAQNADTVTVKLLFWSITTPRFLVIIVSLLIGALVGYVIGNERLKKKMKKVMEVMGSKKDHELPEATEVTDED